MHIEGFWAYFFGALVLGIANAIIKPILAILTLPLILFTLGFFYLLINVGMIALTAWIVPNFSVERLLDVRRRRRDRVDRELGRQRVHRALRPQLRPLIAVSVDFLPFLAISVLLIVMPGPDTAMVTKNALLGGRRSGVYCAVGVAIGLTVWTVAAALGIAALLQASEVAFFALKIAGAIYLIWIGIQMLRTRDPVAASTIAGHGVTTQRRRQGAAAGPAQRPLEPEDRRLLHELPAAVRPRRRPGLRGAADARARLRADHAPVARRLRRRGRPRVGPDAPPGGAQDARPHHGRRADRVRDQARVRAPLGDRDVRVRRRGGELVELATA